MGPKLFLRALNYGPYFEVGEEWCYNSFRGIQNLGPIIGDHRIYSGSTPEAEAIAK